MHASPGSDGKGRFRVLDLVVDIDRATVSRGKQVIDLPELSFRLFAVLVQHAPDAVSKDELIREVWGTVVVGDETLAQRVRLLRQALGEDSQSPRYFVSVRGRGYRLLCDVKPMHEVANQSTARFGLAVAAVLAIAIGTLWFFNTPQNESQDPPAMASIAVLPFADMSASQSYGHFADGMQDELLARLASINGLQVSSRTSVEPYRSSQLGIPEIAEQLQVSDIIEGGVRVDADRIRITVQLIEAETDQHLWADTYDRLLSVQNIFSIQEEVAQQIASVLQEEYADLSAPQSVQLPTDNLAAYEAFLLGQYHTFRPTPENLEIAVSNLERATSLDPNFTEAFAVLGWSYSFLGTSYGNMRPSEAFPKARESALKAIALDSEFSYARSLYGDILTWYDWDFAAAEREYLKALEIDPLNVLSYALFMSIQQRHDEAIELIERRLQANPDEAWAHTNAAWIFLYAGQYDRAITEAQLAGNHPDARTALGNAWLAKGDAQRAIEYFEAAVEDRGRHGWQLSHLALANFRAGRRAQGQALLAELEDLANKQFVSPALLASAYFAAGDADKGFASLQDAVDARMREVIFLPLWSGLDDWRDDPRYLELVQIIFG